MEITNNIHYNKRAMNPSFGAIKYEAAKDTLREVLSLKELHEFKKMADQFSKDEIVDVILFGNGKKLAGRIVDKVGNYRCKDYSPRLFEGKMNFIKRLVKYMQKRTPKVMEEINKKNFEF